jgi:hypothetical protein
VRKGRVKEYITALASQHNLMDNWLQLLPCIGSRAAVQEGLSPEPYFTAIPSKGDLCAASSAQMRLMHVASTLHAPLPARPSSR